MIRIGYGLIGGYNYKSDEQGVWIRYQRKGCGHHKWRKATDFEENKIENDPFYINNLKREISI